MLTRQQKIQFEEQGYLVLEKLIPTDVHDAVLGEYDDLLTEVCRRWVEQGLLPDHVLSESFESRIRICLLYTSPSPRDATLSRMPSSA